MRNRDTEALIHGKNEQLHIRSHECLGGPESPDFGYPEEQIYMDYDEMYGADAYMGDRYPLTDTGHIKTELETLPVTTGDSEISEDVRQEKQRQAVPPLDVIDEEWEIVQSKKRLV